MTLREKINKLGNYYKQVYFRWKHGLVSRERDYSIYSEEEFIEKFFKGDKRKFNAMQLWEGTDQYEDLIITMLREHIEKDLLDVYHVVLDNAKKGEEKAVKTLLLLQKEIRMIAKKKAETKTVDDEDDLIV